MSVLTALKTLWHGQSKLVHQSPIAGIESKYARRLQQSLSDWVLYHQEKIHFKKMRWMGVKTLKNPLDCWIYQEILCDVRPDVVVELGSLAGGSTLFFCHMLDLLGNGMVVSVDIDRARYQVQHPRLTDITGDCSDMAVVSRVKALCRDKSVLIVHDADHTKAAVLRDLQLYADLVSVGSYFIVEDGIVDLFDASVSKRLRWDRGAGPLAAIREFLKHDTRFAIDNERERYIITWNPCGFLKRVR
jgi:cephalosporin hydroxylase